MSYAKLKDPCKCVVYKEVGVVLYFSQIILAVCIQAKDERGKLRDKDRAGLTSHLLDLVYILYIQCIP